VNTTKQILDEIDMKIEGFDHVVFHMPNGKFPRTAAQVLQVKDEQIQHSMTVPYLGNSYSACSLVGLSNVLDNAKSGEKILLTSYGSGAGSDSFFLEVTAEIDKYHKVMKSIEFDKTVAEQINKKKYLSYGQYVVHARKLI
jgi:hydroxymethylglutaryl-CoA synthase